MTAKFLQFVGRGEVRRMTHLRPKGVFELAHAAVHVDDHGGLKHARTEKLSADPERLAHDHDAGRRGDDVPARECQKGERCDRRVERAGRPPFADVLNLIPEGHDDVRWVTRPLKRKPFLPRDGRNAAGGVALRAPVEAQGTHVLEHVQDARFGQHWPSRAMFHQHARLQMNADARGGLDRDRLRQIRGRRRRDHGIVRLDGDQVADGTADGSAIPALL